MPVFLLVSLTHCLPVPCPQDALLSGQGPYTPQPWTEVAPQPKPLRSQQTGGRIQMAVFCRWAARTEPLMRDRGCNQTHVISQTRETNRSAISVGVESSSREQGRWRSCKMVSIDEKRLWLSLTACLLLQSGSSNSLPGAFTPGGPSRQKTVRGETEGDGTVEE